MYTWHTVWRQRLGALLAAASLLPMLLPAAQAVPAASAPDSNASISERKKQKTTAEAERIALQQKLAKLKQEINQTEVAKDNAADTLAASEDAISSANASLRELEAEQKQTEQQLKQLGGEQKKLTTTVQKQQQRLGKWLREQYVAGNEDRIKLLLSGDNPNRINRDLQYMGYLSQAQAKMLDDLRQNLAAVEQTKAAAQQARSALQEIALEQQAQKTLLEQEKQRRASLHAQLAQRLRSQRKEAGNLQRDEQRLSGLVDKLAKMIEEQRKAEAAAAAAAAEKRRLALLEQQREQQRRAKEQREKLEKQQARQNRQLASKPSKPITDGSLKPPRRNLEDEASASSSVAIRNELVPEALVQGTAFASLRGQLRLPLKGALSTRFGSKRGDAPSSKGVFIRAAEGEPVRAVAAGRVVFAEWLRGFGNLIIVDHGNQYMTIYGNNQTLFKRAGDQVKSGDSIASAGNSGGNEESGLYFEMRHQGRAFDPLGWVNIR